MVISELTYPSSFKSAGKLTPARTNSLAYVCLSWCGTMRLGIPTAATHREGKSAVARLRSACGEGEPGGCRRTRVDRKNGRSVNDERVYKQTSPPGPIRS